MRIVTGVLRFTGLTRFLLFRQCRFVGRLVDLILVAANVNLLLRDGVFLECFGIPVIFALRPLHLGFGLNPAGHGRLDGGIEFDVLGLRGSQRRIQAIHFGNVGRRLDLEQDITELQGCIRRFTGTSITLPLTVGTMGVVTNTRLVSEVKG